MLARLHPHQDAEEFEREIQAFASLEEPYICFLAFTGDNEPVAMIDARVRNYAEGAPNLRAAYVEDLWVDPQHRRRGVATALVQAVEQWARTQGHDWLGSDTELANELSQQWHSAAGFEEVERIVVFGKTLD
jgi:aminoglycoside 6'-N-acetyltransferase I